MLQTIIVLFALSTVALSEDKFIFDVTLKCSLMDRDFYRFNMQFVDRDSWLSSDDAITPQKHEKAPVGIEEHFLLEGSLNGDEMWSTAYDVKMILYHDCSDDFKEKSFELNVLPRCELGKGVCHYTIYKDIPSDEVEVEMKYL